MSQAIKGAPSARPAAPRIEEPGRQPTFCRREQGSDDLGPAGKINGLAEPEKHTKPDQRRQALSNTCETASHGPERKHASVEPAQIEAIGTPAHGHLHDGIGPKKGRKQDALERRAQSQVLRNGRKRQRQRGAIQVVDQASREKQPHNRPAARVGDDGCHVPEACELERFRVWPATIRAPACHHTPVTCRAASWPR